MLKKKKTTANGKLVLVKSVRRTRSHRMKFCVQRGLGALPSTSKRRGKSRRDFLLCGPVCINTGMPSPARSLLIHRTMIKSSLWFELHKGGRTMYLVKILNADHRPVDVEVSLEIYRVYEESRKQEERQRYERRKHIEGKSFDDCLLYDLATEPLEETAERLETLLEIGCILEKLPPLQRWRFILHFLYGYSYSEIAKMQDCNKSAVMRSVHSALKKIRKKVAA